MYRNEMILNLILSTRKHYDFINYIFKHCLNIKGKLVLATNQQDMTLSFDITIGKTRIAIRIRNSNINFRDFTIRTTEILKLRSKPTKYYFYAWANKKEITLFIIIDIEQLQKTDILKSYRNPINNYDGTYFYAISLSEIEPYIVTNGLNLK